ncbi:MAG: ABC transporter ATP-binding protein [Rickettsiella sp.]|nr:ABC transporter ATP-binding protein [Rickettsiella sp.]
MKTNKLVLLETKNINKVFHRGKKESQNVLQEINFKIYEGEIVALLGKSGSGKSTLLRVISGLLAPTLGSVVFDGREVNGPNKEMSMVFQSFALFPWLTIYENVAFGLQSLNFPVDIVDDRTRNMINLIGLSGYEKAYPKELSGGMKQRVGFARALAVQPKLLLLDEPFSSLDIFTSHKLRHDLLKLWIEQKINTKSMLLITHSVEEAVMMSDRVVLLDSNPGQISDEYLVTLPREERTKLNTMDLVDQISDALNKQIALAEAA